MASVVSVMGLIVIWSLVWANLPSKEELLSVRAPNHPASVPPPVPELDLSIPGVPATSSPGMGASTEPVRSKMVLGAHAGSDPNDTRARQVLELRCEADVQQICPESLSGEERRQCVAQRLRKFPAPCQQLLRRRLVRWEEAEGAIPACAEDVKRLCAAVMPGDGRILQCLQEHAQEISEPCHQNLPKGHLLVRH